MSAKLASACLRAATCNCNVIAAYAYLSTSCRRNVQRQLSHIGQQILYFITLKLYTSGALDYKCYQRDKLEGRTRSVDRSAPVHAAERSLRYVAPVPAPAFAEAFAVALADAPAVPVEAPAAPVEAPAAPVEAPAVPVDVPTG